MLSNQLARTYCISKEPLHLVEALQIAEEIQTKNAKHYALACVFALISQASNALRHLELALSNSEVSAAYVIEDSDWEGFRGHPEWQKLIEKHRKPAEEKKCDI